MAAMISFDRVTIRFDGQKAIDDLSLSVPAGQIFGLLGPSGSGKTTAIRLMIGVYAPTAGDVVVLGVPPTRWRGKQRQQVGYMPQLSFLYPHLSVSENLNFAASVYGLGWLGRRRRLQGLLEVVELHHERRKLVQALSGGMRKRLSLACALVGDPELIFLDEPTAGIDPILRQEFWQYFRRLRDEGKTLIVTSHYVGEAEHCDHLAIIREGRLVAAGNPGGLRRQALGGEAVDVETPELTLSALRAARQVAGVRDVAPLSTSTLRVFVDDAGQAVPRLTEALRAQAVTVMAIREYRPPFDEVFAKLVQEGDS